MKKVIIDISRNLSPEIAVWPGDTPFKLQTIMKRHKGDSVNLTTITLERSHRNPCGRAFSFYRRWANYGSD